MKSKVGRRTAAYESEAFPYFTMNVYTRSFTTRSFNTDIEAFYTRLEFVNKKLQVIGALGIHVDGSLGFQEVRPEHRAKLMRWFKSVEAKCAKEGQHETLQSHS